MPASKVVSCACDVLIILFSCDDSFKKNSLLERGLFFISSMLAGGIKKCSLSCFMSPPRFGLIELNNVPFELVRGKYR